IVGDDLPHVDREGSLVELLALVDRDHPTGLVAVTPGDDPLWVRNDPPVVQEDRHVVLRRQQGDHVPLEHEIRLDGPLDRLLDIGVRGMDEVPDLLAYRLLPHRQSVDVLVDSSIADRAHGVTSDPRASSMKARTSARSSISLWTG